MGHSVVIIEPFEENILRIHKAIYLEYLQDRVFLVKNALSDKRNKIILMTNLEEANIGGQILLNRAKNFSGTDLQNNKYLVETIFLDDIVDYIPFKKYSKKHRRAIIKIDLKGFEYHAFSNCKKLFALYDIRMIYMEWAKLIQHRESGPLINNMLDFFYSYNLEPFTVNNQTLSKKIAYNDTIEWPWDVIWKRMLEY